MLRCLAQHIKHELETLETYLLPGGHAYNRFSSMQLHFSLQQHFAALPGLQTEKSED